MIPVQNFILFGIKQAYTYLHCGNVWGKTIKSRGWYCSFTFHCIVMATLHSCAGKACHSVLWLMFIFCFFSFLCCLFSELTWPVNVKFFGLIYMSWLMLSESVGKSY